MKAFKKFAAIGICGIVIGTSFGAFSATPATARFINCDNKIENMEKQAAKAYKQGKLSAADYAKVQEEIAFHRQLWGC